MLVLALIGGCVGCGTDDDLTGSVSELVPLEFDRVTVRLQDDWVIITYLRDLPDGTEKVCKLVVDTGGLPAGAQQLEGARFLKRVTLHRSTFAEDSFPIMASGELNFRDFELKEGGEIGGDFIILFETGHDLLGSFSGEALIQQVPDETLPPNG